MNYQEKYLKYKNKYLLAKKQQGGVLTEQQHAIVEQIISHFIENSKIPDTRSEDDIVNKICDIIYGHQQESNRPELSDIMNNKMRKVVKIYKKQERKPEIFEAIKYQLQDNQKSRRLMYTILLFTLFDDNTDLETIIDYFKKSYVILFPDVMKNFEEYKKQMKLLKPNKIQTVIENYRTTKQQDKQNARLQLQRDETLRLQREEELRLQREEEELRLQREEEELRLQREREEEARLQKEATDSEI